MAKRLLEGIRVVDIAGEPLAMTGRMLADMGAEVVKLEPQGGDPLRRAVPLCKHSGQSFRFLAWNAGKTSIEYDPQNRGIDALLLGADVIIETPGFTGALELPDKSAPNAVWLKATPFGATGPRAAWRATDLGILAACGNLYATGFPDRPPNRCCEPTAYAHASAEAAFAILTGLATSRGQHIDLSMQEALMIASMGGAGQYPKTHRKGRRMGASMGNTREIWRCRNGFVSFGLRGGPARAHNFKILLEQLENEGLATPAWRERDWTTYNSFELEDTELRAIEQPLEQYFLRHTMSTLYDLAVATKLMLAPANTAEDILASPQLAAREMFTSSSHFEKVPARFVLIHEEADRSQALYPTAAAPLLNQGPLPVWRAKTAPPSDKQNTLPWAGLKLVEFGSGAAGPIACRYFVEQGATVVKVESRKHPDFLRVMAINSSHGLEGSTLFDALNVGKKSITLNLKHPEGKAIAKQLFHWADAVVENFAPKAMKSYGLDFSTMQKEKPDLLMLSTCLNGQTGPHRDYPGFGGQGAALSGFNYLTGWEDREPIGPYGTITDSLAPRFAASALAAALLHRTRTGLGLHLDISQVEAGIYSLSPWLLEHQANGASASRMGNHSPRAVPHGVFPCHGEDRWIAIVCWTEQQWQALAAEMNLEPYTYLGLSSRLRGRAEIERLLAEWSQSQGAEALAQRLQDIGVEAVPLVDFEDLLERDLQLRHRGHFVPLERSATGASVYERNGFRIREEHRPYHSPSPLLGEHTQEVLLEALKLDTDALNRLQESGAIE
ncbi:MAG: crotonobetainyl-CoA:carnitine CoA-transferase CaiB-like acyl-CoA transferase [Halioglobus sp.]